MTGRISALAAGSLLLIASGVLLLRPLARFWSESENYAYGWGVPLLAAFLFYERWRCRPAPAPGREPAGRQMGLVAVAWAATCLAGRLVLETEPGSRPLLWLAATLWAGALLAWAGLLGGRPWLRHFAFPILFLLAGLPWIFGFEFLLVQELMRLNAAGVAGALHLLGISARAAGNTITLSTGQLGVSEACSGIRSLQAALMMALFFGEFYRFGWRGRVGLVIAGAVLALAGNFARMLYLARRGATEGVAVVEAAHDSTGWTILAVTVLGLWLVCLAARPKAVPLFFATWSVDPLARRAALVWALSIFAATLTAEAATQAWYAFRESSAPHYPAWSVAWPMEAPDFQLGVLPDIMRNQLHADETSAATWNDGNGWRWEGLWIRYRAGAEGKVVFESHNPGLCLPAAGWRPLTATATSFSFCTNGVDLAAQAQSFANPAGTTHVFWIPYLDGGVRAGADRSGDLYGHTLSALADGEFPWLDDVWRGCRRVDAETLELAVTGPPHMADATAAFRKLAPQLVQPDPVPSPAFAARDP